MVKYHKKLQMHVKKIPEMNDTFSIIFFSLYNLSLKNFTAFEIIQVLSGCAIGLRMISITLIN